MNRSNVSTVLTDLPAAQDAPSDTLNLRERTISASAERIAEALSRRKYLVLVLFSGLYFAATCFRAHQKLFWFDELFTVYLSRLPDMASVWGALKQGVDLNPPLFYLFTRFSESLFGEGQIATRLPEIVGFWVFCLCLFRFVSMRTSVLAGAISMLFPLVTTAYFYAYEARSHGVVLGLGGIALVCWQATNESKRQPWWLAGMSAALLLAILTHTYAILLLVPFAVAEFTRTSSFRRIDWGLWLAIATPSLGALVSLPLFQAAKAHIPAGAFPATISALAASYPFHLTPALGVLAAVPVFYFVFLLCSAKTRTASDQAPSLKLEEGIVLVAFAAMPFFSFLLASVTGAPYMDRYSISAIAGFGCLLGIVSARRPPVGLGVLLFLVVQIGFNLVQYALGGAVSEPTTSLRLSTSARDFARRYELMAAGPDKTSPIVLLDALEFLPVMHYAPPEISSRLVYAAFDSDVNGEGYIRLQQCCRAPGRVEKLSEFISSHDSFIAYCNFGSFLRLESLIHEGASVRIEDISPDNVLVSIALKKKERASVVPPRRTVPPPGYLNPIQMTLPAGMANGTFPMLESLSSLSAGRLRAPGAGSSLSQ
jgi:hypothetical protein